jgi:hypothetical protein
VTSPQFTSQRMTYALDKGDGTITEDEVTVDHRELRAWALAKNDTNLDGSEPTINAWSCWHALKRQHRYEGDWPIFDAQCAWALVAADQPEPPDPTPPGPSAGSSESSPSGSASRPAKSGRKTPGT